MKLEVEQRNQIECCFTRPSGEGEELEMENRDKSAVLTESRLDD